MRQSGVVAAAALEGLRKQLPRIRDDHVNAKRLAQARMVCRVKVRSARVAFELGGAGVVGCGGRWRWLFVVCDRGGEVGASSVHSLCCAVHSSGVSSVRTTHSVTPAIVDVCGMFTAQALRELVM